MAWCTVERVTVGDVTVAVQRDAEWDDWRARIVAPRGQINHDADYHTDDREDARMNALYMAEVISIRMSVQP